MLFAPPAVVDVVFVVSGAGNCNLEEVRVLQDGGRGHESAARVAVNAHAGNIYERMAGGQLLYGVFLVFQPVIAQVAVTKVMVPFGAVGMASAVAHRDNNESHLGQAVQTVHGAAPALAGAFYLRAGIYVCDDGVFAFRVKIKRLVHYPVQVGDPVGGFHLDAFREFVSGFK